MPDQLPRARQLAALRTRALLRQEFRDIETAKTVLTRLAGLLDLLDAEEVQEEADDEEQRRRAGKRRPRRAPRDGEPG